MRSFLLWVLKVVGIPLVVVWGLYAWQHWGRDPIGNDRYKANMRRLQQVQTGSDVMVGSSHVYRHVDPVVWGAASGRPITLISGPSQYTTESLLYLEAIAERAEQGAIRPGTRVYFGLEAKLGLGFNFRETYYFSRMRGPLLQEVGLKKPFLSYLIYDAITGALTKSVKGKERPEYYPLDRELEEHPDDGTLQRRAAYFSENRAQLMQQYRVAVQGTSFLTQPDLGLDPVMRYLELLEERYRASGLELVVYIPFGDFDVDMRDFHQRYPGIPDLRYDERFARPELWFDSGHLNAQGVAVYMPLLIQALGMAPSATQTPAP